MEDSIWSDWAAVYVSYLQWWATDHILTRTDQRSLYV
jgi:hypothetical protein